MKYYRHKNGSIYLLINDNLFQINTQFGSIEITHNQMGWLGRPLKIGDADEYNPSQEELDQINNYLLKSL